MEWTKTWTNAVLMFGVSGWKEQIEDSMLLDTVATSDKLLAGTSFVLHSYEEKN